MKNNSLKLQKSTHNWARALSKGLVKPKQLVAHGISTEENARALNSVNAMFDMRIPDIFIDPIKNGNEALKKQFVPSAQELIFFPEELTDPIADEEHTPLEGITHRYPNRVLLKPTYLCASYCRFCFRRYKVSQSSFNLSQSQYRACLDYLHEHTEIWEVILTGGDPLVLTDKYLSQLMNDLSAISHVKIIRFHTRVPSVLPQRITMDLIKILQSSNKIIWIALHANCSDEFTEACREAIRLLVDHGFPIVLQSVLLRGINDSFAALRGLFETAVENRVKPYYLHYPDLAKGTSHFRLTLEEAQTLFAALRGKLSGLCLPTLVLDTPGGRGKISIERSRFWQNADGSWGLDTPLEKRDHQVG